MGKIGCISNPIAMIVVFLFVWTLAANGQEQKLSLQEAMTLALNHNRAVKIANYRLQADRQKLSGARSDYYAKITNQSSLFHVNDLQRVEIPAGALGTAPGGGILPSSKVFLPQGEKTFETSGTEIAQPLTQLIKIHDANRVAAADVGISAAALHATSTNVVFSVRELYYHILTTQLQCKAAVEEIRASDEDLSESTEQLEKGALLQAAQLESRAKAAAAKQTLLAANMLLSDLTTQLDDVLGLPLETKLILDPEVDFEVEVPTPEAALQTALKNNPEVQQADSELSKARAAYGAAKAEYIPNITGFARQSYQNGVSFLDHNFGTFGVAFSYDLFDAGKRRALVRERSKETSEAEENAERVKEEVGVQIAKVYNRLKTTQSMIDVAKESLDAFEENSRLVENQFKQGTALGSKVDASRAQVLDAQAALLSARLEYLLARDELNRILGRSTP